MEALVGDGLVGSWYFHAEFGQRSPMVQDSGLRVQYEPEGTAKAV